MPKRVPPESELPDVLSRKRTADLLRRLRTLRHDVRMLKARMDAAHQRELHDDPPARKRG
jgi:hypothetical protein